MSDEDGPLNDPEARKRAEARQPEAPGDARGRGDATLGRIANLAGGWDVDEGAAAGRGSPEPAPKEEPGLFDRPPRPRASAPPPPRTPPRTAPPPPPRAARPTGAPLPGGDLARPAGASPAGVTAAAAAASALPPPGGARPSAPPAAAATGSSTVSAASPSPSSASSSRLLSRDAELEELLNRVEPKPVARTDAELDSTRDARRPAPPPRNESEGDFSIPVTFGSDSVDKPVDEDFDDFADFAKPAAAPVGRSSTSDSGPLFLPKAPSAASPLAAPAATASATAEAAAWAGAGSAASAAPARATDATTSETPSSKAASAPTAPPPAAASPSATSAAAAAASLSAKASPSALASSPSSSAKAVSSSALEAADLSDLSELAAADTTGELAGSVPVGEFEPKGESRQVRRQLPEGLSRDGAREIVVSESRGDPTMIDSSHLRSDATELREARGAAVADAGIAATLRHAPSLPRRRGVWGDLRYVFTVWAGTRRARREMRKLEAEQLEREKTRRRHLMTIGRAAATSAELDQTQIRKTRGNLQVVDQDRSHQAAQVAASDSEAEAVRRDRAAKAQAHREEIEKLEAEQVQLTEKLEPMQREAAAARRRATDLRNALAKLDARVSDVEAGRGKWADSASQAAELAALRAERQGVARDEPTIAAQLDALVPRIAAIEASRERLRRKVVERNEEEEEDAKRSDELLSALAAKRKVVERATADAEKTRERMLAELGERLYVDRPSYLSAHLSPVDSLDMELGEGQRRIMELKEILASIDRWKQVRGILGWVLILGVIVTGVVFWLMGQFPFLPPPPISL